MNNKIIYKNLALNDDESIVKIIRQSWLRLVTLLILPALLVILPFFFFYPLFYLGSKGVAVFFCSLLVGLILFARIFAIWHLQVLIITNQRLIDCDQKGLFQKIVSNVPLAKIQDVFYRIKGVWQTVTRTGNVYISLVDSKTNIEFNNIAQPQKVQQLILQLKADTLQEKLETTQLSAQELVKLVKKIKAGIGEEKFKDILNEAGEEFEEN